MANHAQTIDAGATTITEMLREDHQKVKLLFDRFDEATKGNEKQNIVTEAIAALEVHAKLEEDLIYPAWREHMDEKDLMDEAREEHHVVHFLIKELKKMDPEDERFDAKFTVLGENVKHHIKEEEGKMFPQAEQADLDWDVLTKHVMKRRQSLEQKVRKS